MPADFNRSKRKPMNVINRTDGAWQIEEANRRVNILAYVAVALAVFVLFMAHGCGVAHASDIDVNRLANAIYKAEGGAKTRHPYGILKKYKHTTPRQACINTIKSNLKRWNGKGDFIEYLSRTYCPIGAKNDPTGLNVNWVKNVTYFYRKLQ